jgi:hypothetical protein
MYGIGDDIIEYGKEIKALKGNVKDLKALLKLVLNNPNNEAVKETVKIALAQIK